MNTVDATLDELTADPHPLLAAARARSPIARLPVLDAWIVTSRAAAIDVMRDPDRFTVDDPRFTTGQIVGPSMLSTDGTEHRRHREPFSGWFTDRKALSSLTDWMRATAHDLVADLAPSGAGELRKGLAAPLAAATVVEMLGLNPPGHPQLLAWYQAIVDGVQRLTAGDDAGTAPIAYRRLAAAIHDAVANRRSDALSHTGGLSNDEIASNAAVIAFGGIETSEGAIANALWHLFSHPETLERIRADRSSVSRLVEESFRLEPAAATIDRYATVDVDLHGASIRAGDYVIVSLAAANRDPAVFAAPDHFDLDRANIRTHTTFARGPHACLGIHLARAQAVAAVDAVLDGLPDAALRADAIGPRGLVFRKATDVIVEWRT